MKINSKVFQFENYSFVMSLKRKDILLSIKEDI